MQANHTKKYRWIGYTSAIQIGFVLISMVVMPTHRIIEERRNALNNRVKKRKLEPGEMTFGPGEMPVDVVFEVDPNYDPATFWERFKRLDYHELFALKNVKENLFDRPYLSLSMLCGATLISAAFTAYTRRMAHAITLLPNQRIRFESFSPFAIGKPPSTVLSVRDISCVSGRKGPSNYSILKLRNYIGYHLVHKTEGVFLNPKLYDEHLGYQRSWHKK